jgi:ABC-2 type transport system ATP-binding protein
VRVRSPQAARLARLLRDAGARVRGHDDALYVSETDCATVGDLAARHGIAVHELSAQTASLEAAFMELTRESTDFRAEVA